MMDSTHFLNYEGMAARCYKLQYLDEINATAVCQCTFLEQVSTFHLGAEPFILNLNYDLRIPLIIANIHAFAFKLYS